MICDNSCSCKMSFTKINSTRILRRFLQFIFLSFNFIFRNILVPNKVLLKIILYRCTCMCLYLCYFILLTCILTTTFSVVLFIFINNLMTPPKFTLEMRKILQKTIIKFVQNDSIIHLWTKKYLFIRDPTYDQRVF